MQLVDYKVRVINSTAGTAARVRVVIESKDDHEIWTTVGVSENVIDASWHALVDSVEYKLYLTRGDVRVAADSDAHDADALARLGRLEPAARRARG